MKSVLSILGASGKARAILPNKFLIEKPAYKLSLFYKLNLNPHRP